MRLKILVVEDDPIQADVLACLLGSHGYYVDVAVDGRCALRRIRAGAFDVALIDYRMPEIDGLGLARVVHTLGTSIDRPRLIALTSSPQDLIGDAGDFDEILGKPIALEPLLRAIERSRPAPATQTEAGTPTPPARMTPPSVSSPGTPTGTPSGTSPGTSPGMAPRTAARAPAGTRRRVLLAEDDAHLREFLRLTLETRGFEVDVATDGLEAVERARTKIYDVVVVDFMMPRLDGLAAAKIIYDLNDRRTRPRIVALTSMPTSLIAQDPRWHLVLDDVVAKASGIPAILSAIENCISYTTIRTEMPLQVVDLQSMMALVQSAV